MIKVDTVHLTDTKIAEIYKNSHQEGYRIMIVQAYKNESGTWNDDQVLDARSYKTLGRASNNFIESWR